MSLLQKYCPNCGDAFFCGANHDTCWCNGLDLSPAQLKMLTDKFDNCLCKKCLSSVAEKKE